MTSDDNTTPDKPILSGLRLENSDEPAVSVGAPPADLREEIDKLFNVLASGEFEARIATRAFKPLEAVQNLLEASGRFRAREQDVDGQPLHHPRDQLLHQARGADDTETDRAVADRMLATLAEASQRAKKAGDSSPEAARIKRILGESSRGVSRGSGEPLDEIYRTFLQDSVSMLETKDSSDTD